MQHLATLSSKYQITVPKSLRLLMDLQAGDKIEMKLTGRHATLQKAPDISELSGCLHKYAIYPVPTDEETDVAVLDYVRENYAAKTARSR